MTITTFFSKKMVFFAYGKDKVTQAYRIYTSRV